MTQDRMLLCLAWWYGTIIVGVGIYLMIKGGL